MAAHGYPGTVRQGDEISGIEQAEALGVRVFEAGTKMLDGRKVSAGGRVLGVTTSAPDLPAALEQAYRGVAQIHFAGQQFRRDIGRKGLKRYTS
jgi:phosphoribosylamine--glycine ligase